MSVSWPDFPFSSVYSWQTELESSLFFSVFSHNNHLLMTILVRTSLWKENWVWLRNIDSKCTFSAAEMWPSDIGISNLSPSESLWFLLFHIQFFVNFRQNFTVDIFRARFGSRIKHCLSYFRLQTDKIPKLFVSHLQRNGFKCRVLSLFQTGQETTHFLHQFSSIPHIV